MKARRYDTYVATKWIQKFIESPNKVKNRSLPSTCTDINATRTPWYKNNAIDGNTTVKAICMISKQCQKATPLIWRNSLEMPKVEV